MKVNLNFFAANPFIDAYTHSDFLGKLIILGLVALSVACWIILIYKWRMTHLARKYSAQFQIYFNEQKGNPLALEAPPSAEKPNPFLDLYTVLKKHTIDILNKNRRFGAVADGEGGTYLSSTDLDVVESYLFTSVASQTKRLEKNLFVLSTIVSLAPFLGLLGTVWGILTTFSDLQAQSSGGGTQQMILGGLSLALATTVLGLIDAIPALIGYNYLKSSIRDFNTDMESFATEILTSVERQYRKVDLQK